MGDVTAFVHKRQKGCLTASDRWDGEILIGGFEEH